MIDRAGDGSSAANSHHARLGRRRLRQFRPVTYVGATLFTIGVALMVAGSATAGLWLSAFSVVIVIASRVGVVRTDYQRSVAAAMRPISRRMYSMVLPVDRRADALRRVEGLAPPTNLGDLHTSVTDAMQRRLARQAALEGDVKGIEGAIAEKRAFDAARRLSSGPTSGDNGDTYAQEVCAAISEFVDWYETNLTLYKERLQDALVQLRAITPPKRKETAHRALAEAIEAKAHLVVLRQTRIDVGDVQGVVEAGKEIVAEDARMRAALKEIRGWL